MSPMPTISDEGRSNVSLVASSASTDSTCQNNPELRERNYMGLSECSSVERSVVSIPSEKKETSLNLKATELRLGLPGSKSPPRDPELCPLGTAKLDEKPLFPLAPLQKTVVSGNKRGFSDAMDGFPKGNFSANHGVNTILSSRPPVNSGLKTSSVKDQVAGPPSVLKDSTKVSHEKMSSPNNAGSAPAAKAQVVGWPPIRSFRKNTLATSSKNSEELDGKPGSGALFVKVSMDGAPYLRKVDVKTYSSYMELSSALEKMFSCFTIGQYGSHGVPGNDKLSESKLRDLLHGSEYVLTYEDKDSDWMLVGDVPWEMFIDSCKRLRIMKGSDAIGLGVPNRLLVAMNSAEGERIHLTPYCTLAMYSQLQGQWRKTETGTSLSQTDDCHLYNSCWMRDEKFGSRDLKTIPCSKNMNWAEMQIICLNSFMYFSKFNIMWLLFLIKKLR